MRRKLLTRSVVFIVIFCVFIIMLVVGVIAGNIHKPPADMPFFNEEQDFLNTEETPPPPTQPIRIEPEPPSDTQPPPAAEPGDMPESQVVPAREAVLTSLPVRMRIPALSLDYEIRGTGADSKGTMQIVPALEMVSWFTRSAIPGNEGNAIFGAHNTWGGVRSKVFTLDELEIGDEMEIDYADGTTLKFLLESVFVYELRTAPAHLIMDVRGDARATLITCKWPFNTTTGTSDNRIVAIFKEESVFITPDPPIEPFPPREPQ